MSPAKSSLHHVLFVFTFQSESKELIADNFGDLFINSKLLRVVWLSD
ncbi:hypothetical protein TH15OA1_920002 [Vibrio harveyi]|nr:hypothetical protein TH15OA1_920002 [Vibrio harveyi]